MIIWHGMEGSGDREPVQRARRNAGWIWVFGEVLAEKGMAGVVGTLLRSRGTEGEERRGWWGSGAGGTTRRKEEGRPGLGRATQMEDGVGAVGGGGRRSVTCEQGRGGWLVWAMHEGVGRPGKGGSWAGPVAKVSIFYLNEYSN
jgi:hypothetical protein